MSLYDWLLFLHVLAAFSLVAAAILLTFVILSARRLERPSDIARLFRFSRAGDVMFGVGAIGTIVLGIWLAIDVDDYELWDGWVIAALVLWAVLMAVAGRSARFYYAARDRAHQLVAEGRDAPSPQLAASMRSSTGLVLQAATLVVLLLLLIDMIYKPGA